MTAIAIEARRDETGTGSVHESAGRQASPLSDPYPFLPPITWPLTDQQNWMDDDEREEGGSDV